MATGQVAAMCGFDYPHPRGHRAKRFDLLWRFNLRKPCYKLADSLVNRFHSYPLVVMPLLAGNVIFRYPRHFWPTYCVRSHPRPHAGAVLAHLGSGGRGRWVSTESTPGSCCSSPRLVRIPAGLSAILSCSIPRSQHLLSFYLTVIPTFPA